MTAASPDQLTRDVYDLMGGSLRSVGNVTLAVAPATTTTVTHPGVSTNSFVSLHALNDAAATAGIAFKIACSQGQFVITHPSDAGSREYRYHFHTPRRPL